MYIMYVAKRRPALRMPLIQMVLVELLTLHPAASLGLAHIQVILADR